MTTEKKIEPQQQTSSNKTSISILTLSIIVFFYFAIMILLSKLKYNAPLLSVMREMLTIPGFIFLGIGFIISLVSFIKNKLRTNSLSFYAIIIQLATVALIVYIA